MLAKLPIEAGGAPAQDLAPLLAMGEEVLASGDGERAASIFAQIVEIAPDSAAAIAGLLRALTAGGRIEEAEALLADLPPELAAKTADRARAHRARAGARPARRRRACAAARRRGRASRPTWTRSSNSPALHLPRASATPPPTRCCAMIAADREWNEGAAKAKLLQMFEAIGLEDPWVAATRRRLSTILFG